MTEEFTPLTADQITTLLSLGGGSVTNSAANPVENPSAFEFFAFVVAGKVAAIFMANKEHMQDYITAWSSNPITVKLASAQKNVVANGWNYDSTTGEFSQPE